MHNLKGLDTNNNVNLALLQVRSSHIGAGLSCPTMLLFNRPTRCLLPQMNREPIDINNDDAKYETLKAYQEKCVKDIDTPKRLTFSPCAIL